MANFADHPEYQEMIKEIREKPAREQREQLERETLQFLNAGWKQEDLTIVNVELPGCYRLDEHVSLKRFLRSKCMLSKAGLDWRWSLGVDPSWSRKAKKAWVRGMRMLRWLIRYESWDGKMKLLPMGRLEMDIAYNELVPAYLFDILDG